MFHGFADGRGDTGEQEQGEAVRKGADPRGQLRLVDLPGALG